MNNLRIIVALIRWLYFAPHPLPVKHTVRNNNGTTWFLVEPGFISIPVEKENDPFVVIDGRRYVKIGGGDNKGKYIYAGDEPSNITIFKGQR